MIAESVQMQECETYSRALNSRTCETSALDCPSDSGLIYRAIDEIHSRYRLLCATCILRALNFEDVLVIASDEDNQMRNYCAFSKLKMMTEEEARNCDRYNAKPEYAKHFEALNRHWTAREKQFLLENLRKKLQREPSEKELNAAFIQELLSPGKSQTRRFRAYYATAFPDRVEDTGKIPDYVEASKRIDECPAKRVAKKESSVLEPAIA